MTSLTTIPKRQSKKFQNKARWSGRSVERKVGSSKSAKDEFPRLRIEFSCRVWGRAGNENVPPPLPPRLEVRLGLAELTQEGSRRSRGEGGSEQFLVWLPSTRGRLFIDRGTNHNPPPRTDASLEPSFWRSSEREINQVLDLLRWLFFFVMFLFCSPFFFLQSVPAN